MKNELIEEGIKLAQKAEAVYLTTIDKDGFPATRAMLNLRNKKQYPQLAEYIAQFNSDFTLFFTTNTSSVKIEQIRENNRVSVYFCDPASWHGFMCQGEIEIVKDKKIKHALWLDKWIMYYPEGKDSEDFAILKLKPLHIKSYFQFKQLEQYL